MDRNNIIGFVLIFIITIAYLKFMAPSEEQLAEEKRIQDSIELVSTPIHSGDTLENRILPQAKPVPAPTSDSIKNQLLNVQYGVFANAIGKESKTYILENDQLKIEFSSKGGQISKIWLKGYKKIKEDSAHQRISTDLFLLGDDQNKFEYIIPYPNTAKGFITTGELDFLAEVTNQSIEFSVRGSNGETIIQKYVLSADSYVIDYNIEMQQMSNVIPPNHKSIILHWEDYLDKIEQNSTFEKTYSTTYYKLKDENVDYLSERKEDEEYIQGKKVEWISHTNQFFNISLIPNTPFDEAKLITQPLEDEDENLKILTSNVGLPLNAGGGTFTFPMRIYMGPNSFNNLRAFDNDLEDIIPFGWSIFGTINRWVIRPLFNFLSGLIGSKGLSIILLTLIVKLLLYPLTYKMLHSQAKMSALKPEIAKLKEKLKGDQQKQQMETMKLYREYGVNPLGGCMPMVLQMPIWFALYRFFPAAIEFRQESFWWATDLSSYDVLTYLPWDIPMVGAHLSLFTILWAITTLIYTYYNSQMMDMSANPAMKYMQYIMPIFFLGFFNNYAAGLTAYLFFSNLFNIAQTIVTKNVIFNDEKIREELHLNKSKPKKKSGFQSRLEQAMKEQQKIKDSKKKSK